MLWTQAGYPNNSNQFWHYLCGDSVWSHTWRVQLNKTSLPLPTPPPHPNHTHAFSHQSQARLLPVLLMNWLQVRGSRIPPTLGSINLPKLLTELREMLYLLDHQRRELRKVQMKELLRARYREGAWSFHGRPRAPLSQHPHLSTNPEAVWTQLDFYGGFTA